MKQRRMGPRTRWAFLLFSTLIVLTVSGCTPNWDSFNTVTDRGDRVRWLMNLSFVLSFMMLALVFGLLLYSMIRFRKGRPSEREGNKKLEIFWIVAPALLLVVLFVFSIRTMNAVIKDHPADADVLTVRVIGNQWWWAFEYPDLGITTANELHVPTDRPIKLELQSDDVVHSFWVPQIGWKLDTIPGRTNIMNFTVDQAGTFDGACAEFCGTQHAWMRIKIIASPASDFATWTASQSKPAVEPSSLLARDGENTFMLQSCAACHNVSGTAANGKVGPDLTHFGSRETLGAGVLVNNPANLEAWIRDPSHFKPGIVMPAFNRLSDQEIQALVQYLEGLK